MDYIFKRLSDKAKAKMVKFPVLGQNVAEYVDQLLTLDEQELCDTATD